MTTTKTEGDWGGAVIMRLHTDVITTHDILKAADVAGVHVMGNLDVRRSRTHSRAFDVHLSGSGWTSGRGGHADYPAATWDEWGIFMNALYDVDPLASWGSSGRPAYADREAFRCATQFRFDTLTPDQQHKRHKWSWQYPHVTCKCGASVDNSFMYLKR